MSNFEFSLKTSIIAGENSIGQIPELIKRFNLIKPFIISGPHLKKLGIVSKIASLSGADSDFCETEANPSVETVEKATHLFKSSGCQSIIAIGGGSPIDVAKAVAVTAKYGGSITAYEGAHKVPGKTIPHMVIPTTAGTGSEVTAFSVITDKSRNYKLTVFSNELLPVCAVLDPTLIYSVPAFIAAACGADALVHAIESYLSKAANSFTDAMAEKSMELIGGSLERYVLDRTDKNAAADMLLGSTYAGIAFSSARLGNVHAMAHPLGGFYNIPHGVANAVLLPHVLKFNAEADNGRFLKIYNIVFNKQNASLDTDSIVTAIAELMQKIGIPENLSYYDVKEDKISAMAEDAMKSGNILVNPRTSSKIDIENLYRTAL